MQIQEHVLGGAWAARILNKYIWANDSEQVFLLVLCGKKKFLQPLSIENSFQTLPHPITIWKKVKWLNKRLSS